MLHRLKKTLLFLSGGLLLATVVSFTPKDPPKDPQKEINIWHKVSDDELNPGEIIPLDMSEGYSFCAGPVLYIIVSQIGSEDDIAIAFPNRGYWESPKPDEFLEELQNEFDNLEEYLRNKGSSEWKKK